MKHHQSIPLQNQLPDLDLVEDFEMFYEVFLYKFYEFLDEVWTLLPQLDHIKTDRLGDVLVEAMCPVFEQKELLYRKLQSRAESPEVVSVEPGLVSVGLASVGSRGGWVGFVESCLEVLDRFDQNELEGLVVFLFEFGFKKRLQKSVDAVARSILYLIPLAFDDFKQNLLFEAVKSVCRWDGSGLREEVNQKGLQVSEVFDWFFCEFGQSLELFWN